MAVTGPVYIGDEIGAAGHRLAGTQVLVPGVGEEAQALSAACRHGTWVLLSSEIAQRLPAAVLAHACAARHPLVLVVPDTQGQVPRPDLALRLRTQLGLVA